MFGCQLFVRVFGKSEGAADKERCEKTHEKSWFSGYAKSKAGILIDCHAHMNSQQFHTSLMHSGESILEDDAGFFASNKHTHMADSPSSMRVTFQQARVLQWPSLVNNYNN